MSFIEYYYVGMLYLPNYIIKASLFQIFYQAGCDSLTLNFSYLPGSKVFDSPSIK